MMRVYAPLLLSSLVLLSLAPTPVFGADLSAGGTWTGEGRGGTATGTVTLELTQNGTALKGTYEAIVGTSRQFYDVDGALEGRKVSLKMLNTAFGQLTATISEDGKTMSGSGIGATNTAFSFTLQKTK